MVHRILRVKRDMLNLRHSIWHGCVAAYIGPPYRVEDSVNRITDHGVIYNAIDPQKHQGQFNNKVYWRTDGELEFLLFFATDEDFINCGDSPDLYLNNEMSVTFWCYHLFNADSYQGCVARYNSGNNQRGWYVGYLHDGDMTVYTSTAGTSGSQRVTGSVTNNTWEHWSYTRDNDYEVLYKNGEIADEGVSQGALHESTEDVIIGGWAGGGGTQHFNGGLHTILLHNRRLSQEEVKFIYKNSKTSLRGNQSFLGGALRY